MDHSGREILWNADVHRGLHKLRLIIILIQNGTQDGRRARQRVKPTVSTLDCDFTKIKQIQRARQNVGWVSL